MSFNRKSVYKYEKASSMRGVFFCILQTVPIKILKIVHTNNDSGVV